LLLLRIATNAIDAPLAGASNTPAMSAPSQLLIRDHRGCDGLLADVESEVQERRWSAAKSAWTRFERAMLCHFAREEDVLFPAFEQATGHTQGPTAVMRMEHEQMRALLGSLSTAVQKDDQRRFLDYSESLMLLIQQHNMKEEQILYPMCDQVVPGHEQLLQRLQAVQPEPS
jgi:iron-sulfur cluster repair protein YtfE (RIC family)